MDYVTEPRRLRRRRRPAPLLLLILAAVVVMGLLAAVVLSLRDRRSQPEPEADPHAGQVYVNDGANMVWLTPHEGFPVSALPQEDFRRDENEDGTPGQRVRYIGADYATRWGVDVSNYQGTIDWAALKQQGVEFAYLRIGLRGYGEAGTLYPDRSFVRYYEGAQAAGIDVGVYMFSQAATPLEAAEEALYVQQLLDGRELQLPVYYDWEPVLQEDSRTLNSSRLLLTAQARVFCELIEKSGYDAGVYMNRQQGYYRYDLKTLSPYKLWIADYGDWPDFYYRFDVWQYAADGRLDGVKRSGVVLDEAEVIEAWEHGEDKKYIPIRMRYGKPTPDSLMTAERLGLLSRHIGKTLTDMARQLNSGSIAADPYYRSQQENACLNCDYFDACHFSQGENGESCRFQQKIPADKVIEMMEGEDGNG